MSEAPRTPAQQDIADLVAQFGLDIPQPAPRGAPLPRAAAQPLPPTVQQAISEALGRYVASPEYAELAARLPTLNLFELRSRLGAALGGPHFAPLLAALRDPAAFDIDWGTFVPKAVSIGVLAQGSLGIGFLGGTGLVMNLSGDPDQSVFFGGAISLGLDVGIEGTPCIGLWTNTVEDLNGHYVGADLNIDDGFGVTVVGFKKDEDLAIVFAGFDIGIDDGFDGEDAYFLHIPIGREPIYQAGESTYLVQLDTMTCNDSESNYDEIYFEFLQDSDSTKYRYPCWDGYQMAEEKNDPDCNSWQVGLIAKFNETITLRLHVAEYTMDDKTVSASDFVNGAYTFVWDTKVQGFNEIKYTLNARLLKG